MNPTFDITIANFLECHRRELFVKLEDALVRSKVVRHFEGRRLITTYKNKDGNYKEFVLRDISLKGADEQYAYNGYMSITVKQHYFVRHDIVLHYPANPCAVEITGKENQHYNYFPLETVRLAPVSTTTSKARRYVSKLLQRPFQRSKENKAHRSQIAHRVNNMMKRHYEQKRIFDKLKSSKPSTNYNDELFDPLVSLLDKLAISDNENEHHYETLSLGTTTTDEDSDMDYGPPPDTIIYMDEVDLPSYSTRKPPSEMEVVE